MNRDGQFLGGFKQRERRFCVKKKAIYLRTFTMFNFLTKNITIAGQPQKQSTNLVKQEPNKDRNSNNKKIAKNSQTKTKNHKTSTKKLFLKNKKSHEISQISKEKPKNLNKN